MKDIDLSGFTGTTAYYHYSPLFRRVLLTDGTYYLCEKAACYWLMDAIASHLYRVPSTTRIVFADFTGGTLVIAKDFDGDKPIDTIARQHIDSNDFPLPSIRLFVARHNGGWVIHLPSEY